MKINCDAIYCLIHYIYIYKYMLIDMNNTNKSLY